MYHTHLSKDKILKSLIKQQGTHELQKRNNILLVMCGSIISQQLSTKVADVIYARFLALFGKKSPKAADILKVSHEQLRAIGLSNAKAQYVKNVCTFFTDNKLTDAKLHKMDNDALLQLLTQIKGVGQWTVEMILMFAFAREDVFSTGDLGIQKAMIALYEIEYINQKELHNKMLTIAEAWRPYRTYASRHLWRYLDGGGVGA